MLVMSKEDALNQFLQNALAGLNIYLIGMMGSGKTTVGQLLASHLEYRFLDTDALIEKVAGQSIPDLFASQGESTFRQLESQVLSELSAYACQKLAIATGGGIVLQRENWSYLHHGIVIWLDVDVAVLCDRLRQDATRPLLQGTDADVKLQTLLQQRQPLYAQADLHITVQEQDTPEHVVAQILETIPQVLKSHPRATTPLKNRELN
jgi:shikimate kinase